MDNLRLGRYSLFFAAVSFVAMLTTFFIPTLFVLFGLFAMVVLVLGLLGVRTRAGRIGLSGVFVVLPLLTFLTYQFGFEARTYKKPLPSPRSAEVYFSPNGGCTDAIISQIAEAKHSVLVQACYFTSTPIAAALVAAHERGVSVQVILDKSQDTGKYSVATYLSNHDIFPWIDAAHAIAHNKVIIIDDATVITGSFNFTGNAETKNAENVLVLHDRSLAATYTANWDSHVDHSYMYLPPTP